MLPCPVSQPVKLSDELVLEARTISAVAERSIAGQIEYWAQLGRAIEPLLQSGQALALKQAGNAVPLSKSIGSADTPAGQTKVRQYLETRPYPHFE